MCEFLNVFALFSLLIVGPPVMLLLLMSFAAGGDDEVDLWPHVVILLIALAFIGSFIGSIAIQDHLDCARSEEESASSLSEDL